MWLQPFWFQFARKDINHWKFFFTFTTSLRHESITKSILEQKRKLFFVARWRNSKREEPCWFSTINLAPLTKVCYNTLWKLKNFPAANGILREINVVDESKISKVLFRLSKIDFTRNLSGRKILNLPHFLCTINKA